MNLNDLIAGFGAERKSQRIKRIAVSRQLLGVDDKRIGFAGGDGGQVVHQFLPTCCRTGQAGKEIGKLLREKTTEKCA